MGNHQTVEECITITNDCLSIGGFAFPAIAEKLTLFGTVGTLLLHVNNLSRDDVIMQRLVELERKMSQLVEKMAWQFDDLKAFIVEVQFRTEISQTASTLFKYLNDVIKNPNEHSIGLFRDAAQRTPPLHCAYKFISMFEDDATNPMILAMKADRYRTDATFQRWRTIVDGVLSQLLILETFINGMFWEQNMYGPNELKAKIYGIHGRMDWLKGHYKNTYWPTAVENIIHNAQDNDGIRGNDNKALEIKKHLMSILNDHIFYIIVYDACGTYENHSFSGNDDQYMCSFRRGGCNVVIYRSFHFLNCQRSAHEQMKDEVESCRNNAIPASRDYKGFPQKLRDDRIRHTGFVGMIDKKFNVVVRSANSHRAEWGPGWWITAKTGKFGGHAYRASYTYRKDFILIAGFQ